MPIGGNDKNFDHNIVNLVNEPVLLGYSARPGFIAIVFQTLDFAGSRSRMFFQLIQ